MSRGERPLPQAPGSSVAASGDVESASGTPPQEKPASASGSGDARRTNLQTSIGFLTVLEHELHGLVGGYLLLNPSGRPLEFHCTAPVKPNRAQQILFGPTLESYLYGEQIGQTLVNKSSLEPLAVYTDVEAALSVREFVQLPVALVLASPKSAPPAPEATSLTPSWRVDAAHRGSPHLSHFVLGRNNLAVAARRDADRAAILAGPDSLSQFDLSEPFARIREAVEEAHKGSR